LNVLVWAGADVATAADHPSAVVAAKRQFACPPDG